MQGEVVGINTLIFTTGTSFTQGNIGIGFAINSNVGRGVFNQLAKNGRVTRGFLAFRFNRLTKQEPDS
jgi:S1-C subfamily serine protease